jgi:hypothetical protein
MQQNCHEFIAYENLVPARGRGDGARSGRNSGDRVRPAGEANDISKVLPLVKRALKVLSDREVAPQLGLLKSTLLQLDSTFSEREYGAGGFRDFMEKVARTGAVTLRHAGRSMLVEAREDANSALPETAPVEPVEKPAVSDARTDPLPRPADETALPTSALSLQDGVRAVSQGLAGQTRWPLYARQVKQVLRNAIEGFDERKYGFASVVDLLRAAGSQGVLRIERDRQGAIRVFPGTRMVGPEAAASVTTPTVDAPLAAVAESVPVDAGAVVELPTPEQTAQTPMATPTKKPARKRSTTKRVSGPTTPRVRRPRSSRAGANGNG